MKDIIRKITSRKFIVALIGVVVGLAAFFGVDEAEYTQIAGLVTTVASVVSYIIGEAKIDAARAGANNEAGKDTEEGPGEDSI